METLQQRLDFVGLGEGAETRFEPIAESLSQHLGSALQDLSRRVANAPSSARFLFGRERIEADGGGLAARWQKLITGQIDTAFADAATRTGQRHARIGVDPRWHAGSHAVVVQTLIRGVVVDCLERAMKVRRGPLAILDGRAPAHAAAEAQAIADGIAALVGAVLIDTELHFAGYLDRVRLDAEARLAAERSRLGSAVAAAGHALDLAAQGRRDDKTIALAGPELAPLREGTEKLAGRVIGLVEDLELSGKAMNVLAEQVLQGLRRLSSDSAAEAEDGNALARALAELSPSAMALASGLEEHGRARRADQRRLRRGAREVENLRVQLATTGGKSPGSAGKLPEADHQLAAIALLFERLAADCGAETRSLTVLDRLSSGLVAALSTASVDATGLAARLTTTGRQGAELEQSTAEALEGAGVLAGLVAMTTSPENREPVADAAYPLPDETALAAHWHAV